MTIFCQPKPAFVDNHCDPCCHSENQAENFIFQSKVLKEKS